MSFPGTFKKPEMGISLALLFLELKKKKKKKNGPWGNQHLEDLMLNFMCFVSCLFCEI